MTAVELWLPVGAIAFYIYDSAQLLWQNELLFMRAGNRWRIAGDSPLRRWGRRVVLPNPLLPDRALFRIAWSPDDHRTAVDDTAITLLQALGPIRVISQLLLWLLILLLPMCWIIGAGFIVLLQFALYYALIGIALVLVFRRRTALRLTNRADWALAFDVLACAPFAVNLVRKLTLHHGIGGDPIAFAQRHFDPAGRAALAALIRRRLDEQQAAEPPTPQRQQQIAQWLARLGDSAA